MTEPPAVRRTLVRLETRGDDLAEAIESLPRLYQGSAWTTSATEGPYSYRYAARGDQDLTLRTSRMSGRLRGDIPGGGDLVVQWLLAGRAVVDLGEDEIAMVPGRPLLFPAHRTFLFDASDWDQRLVHLNPARVADIAAEGRGARSEPLRFDHRVLPDAPAVAFWLDTIALVSRALSRGTVNDLLWYELTRMTAIAFLQLVPPRSPAEDEAFTPGTRRVRLAIQHAEAHPDKPLGPADLARAAGVSVRTLQDAFLREVGVTPAAYLRGVRLDRVDADLRDAVPVDTTVADVARRWGFANLGRFAAQYAQRFGRYPSETLRD